MVSKGKPEAGQHGGGQSRRQQAVHEAHAPMSQRPEVEAPTYSGGVVGAPGQARRGAVAFPRGSQARHPQVAQRALHPRGAKDGIGTGAAQAQAHARGRGRRRGVASTVARRARECRCEKAVAARGVPVPKAVVVPVGTSVWQA